MITGAHSILYSTSSDADRAFLRDVLKFPSVDVGGGWLIFGLPPSEIAVHPSEGSSQELYLMCDDIEAFVGDMRGRGIVCAEVQNQGWGLLTTITLPGGGRLGVYQPRHARPEPMGGGKAPAKRSAAKKKSAAKKAPVKLGASGTRKPAAKKKVAAKKKPAKKGSKPAAKKR